ncbi:MAG: TetR family transcriptional regulator [Hyphomicrobiales bacterium]
MPALPKTANVVPLPRKISRDQRRQQLIDATMRVLARKGYSQTTLSDVAVEAGVSHGLVNFHFESKEKLLTATLLFLSEEYRANWMAALAAAGEKPAHKLAAILAADFNDAISKPERLACWCSFWGEVQSRPLYQQECSANDDRYIAQLESICAAIVAEGNYNVDPVRVARVLRHSSEGQWNDMLSMTVPYTRDEALKTLFTCAAGFFPKHFTIAGPIGG